jgi:hypothetical protein
MQPEIDAGLLTDAAVGRCAQAMPGQKASVGVTGVIRSWNVTKAKATTWVNGHQAALSALKAALGKGTVVANGGQNPHTSGFSEFVGRHPVAFS